MTSIEGVSTPGLLAESRQAEAAAFGRGEKAYFALVAVFTAISFGLDLGGVYPGFVTRWFTPGTYALALPLVSLAALLYWALSALRIVHRRFRARREGREDQMPALSDVWRDPRPWRALALATSALLLLNVFGCWKAMIPQINPFSWDPAFATVDRVLHLGRDPWLWLHQVFGDPLLTRQLDVFYSLWFYFVPLMVLWMSWTSKHEVRQRFFLTFALCWIVLGTVAATVFSSAGPAYYARVTGDPGAFRDLMVYLDSAWRGHPFNARVGQELLWAQYVYDGSIPWARISAMPSLHIAMVFLYAITASAANRVIGVFFWMYALLVLIGSVHLGWHYAVDGYAAIAAVAGFWWLSGRIIRS